MDPVAGVAARETAVGIAYSTYTAQLVAREKGLADFVEIPFEQLVRTPSVIEIRDHIPVVLHSASLSLAGNAPPASSVVDRLAYWIEATKTPWLGEHLAYVRADGLWKDVAEHMALTGAGRSPPIDQSQLDIGYTVSPQFSAATLQRVIDAVSRWQKDLGLPVLLENGPIYFEMPGSTLSQFAFIRRLCAEPNVKLLLDLTHLAITCGNLDIDSSSVLDKLPLEHVVEVHISGMARQEGILWDDHSEAAPPVVFTLLKQLLRRVKPRAITIEYNWAEFPDGILRRDIECVRSLVDAAACVPSGRPQNAS